MTGKVVVIQGLVKRFGAQEILSGVDLEVSKGEVVVIVGNIVPFVAGCASVPA